MGVGHLDLQFADTHGVISPTMVNFELSILMSLTRELGRDMLYCRHIHKMCKKYL